MDKFKRIYTALEDWVSGILLVGGITVIFYSVVMRYIFNQPQSWTDEVATYMVVWGTFIGTAVALRNDHHIKVDLFYGLLPPTIQRWVSIFANVVGIAFCIFLTWAAVTLELKYLSTGQRSTNILWPLWIIYAVLPLTGILLGVRFVEKLYYLLKEGGRHWLIEQQSSEGGHF